jgi:hypothetical protein
MRNSFLFPSVKSALSAIKNIFSQFFSVFFSLCLCVSSRCTHLRVAHSIFYEVSNGNDFPTTVSPQSQA